MTLTLVPVLASYWFKGGVREKPNRAYEWMKRTYAVYLDKALDRRSEGVRLSQRMRAQYPAEMTIVLQHQFWDLKLDHEARTISVGLSFGGVPSTLVSNDSGALHLAAALGIPVTAIYGPTDERYSLPLTSSTSSPESVHAIFHPVFCRPCGLRDCPIDHRCMKRISPDRVFESVRQQLQS